MAPKIVIYGAKNRDLRCVLQPAPPRAGCKTCLESSVKKFHRICIYLLARGFQARSGTTLARSLDMWLSSVVGAAPGGGGRGAGRGAAGNNIHVDAVPWPQNTPCAKLGVADTNAVFTY